MREVDGKKVAFVNSEDYFASLYTSSMHSTAKETGADVVFLLAEGITEADVTDAEVRDWLTAAISANEVSRG